MDEKDLREQFLMALSKIKGWKYEDTIKKEYSLEIRAIIEKYIFQELPEEDKDLIVRRAKSHSMPLPPPIVAMKDVTSAQQQIISVMALMQASDKWEDFEELQKKRSSKKDKPPVQPEPLTDFDKILLGIMAVPKPDKSTDKEEPKK